jgi:ribosomal protein S18 acetylase RimI-like enzyme
LALVSTELELRRATLADRAIILAFHRALYVTHRDRILPPDMLELIAYRDFETVLREDVEAMLKSDQTIVLLGFDRSRAVGYISGRIQQEPRRLLRRRGVIEDWYVDEAHRGKGHGSALLLGLESALREAGCELLESATWAFNDSARRAHDALGFKEVQIQYRKRIETE